MKSTSFDKSVNKYLKNYSEPESQQTIDDINSINTVYEHCIIIPVCDEEDTFIQRLLTVPPHCDSLLIILVINQVDTQADASKNRALWNQLVHAHQTIVHHENRVWLAAKNHGLHLLLINRFDNKIPYQQGVGLARKIGGDIACQLYQHKQLLSPWAHHTDADVILPRDYFSACHEYHQTQYSALVYPYHHINSGDESLFFATQLYEQALAYYVDGLKKAGSPYAYHTLGSCIVCTHYSYAACRGFPKKSAGEDFYLLNKLAKVGRIGEIQHTTLAIESRLSDRVPFGTGPAVKKIMENKLNKSNYLYYHPQCFKELGNVLQAFDTLYITEPTLWLSDLSSVLQEALQTLNIDVLFQHLNKQMLTKEQHLKHCHDWLDAFKSLKLIHCLEKHFPKIPLQESYFR